MVANLVFFAPGTQPMQSKRLEEHTILGLDGASRPNISMGGNRFHITGKDGVTRTHDQLFLNMVIVDVAADFNKAWWPTPDTEGPPHCWSDDGRVPVGPESARPLVQSGAASFPARSCAECPMQMVGSKGDGSDYKACGTKKRMAVLLPDEIAGPDDLGTVYQVNLGAYSVSDKKDASAPGPRGLRQYQQFLKSQTGVGPSGVKMNAVITRVEFDAQTVPVLMFSVAARSDGYVLWLDVDVQDAVADLLATDDIRNVLYPTITNRNSVPRVASPADVTPRLAQTTATAATAPAPAVTQTTAAPPARAKPPAIAAPKLAVPTPPAPAPAPPTDDQVLAKCLDLFEVEHPDTFADMAAWATHETTSLVDALAWFKENTWALYTRANPPIVAPVAPPKLVAPPVAPAAPAKPKSRAPAAVKTAPAAPVVALVSDDGSVDEMAEMLGQLGADL